MKKQIKHLRVHIDGLHQLTKELKPINKHEGFRTIPFMINSKEIEDATHSLIYAKAWLGKMLSELGEENPYKSGYKTVTDIEPTADKSELVAVIGKNTDGKEYKNFNHIEKVDWLRTEIQKLIRDTDYITSEVGRVGIYGLRVEQYLCEARFALGFELERIKEENK